MYSRNCDPRGYKFITVHVHIILYLPELMIGSGAVENTDPLTYHGSLTSPSNMNNPSETKYLNSYVSNGLWIRYESIWSFLWLIAFCLLCNRWQNTRQDFLTENEVSPDGPRTAIAFNFFSMVVLIILGFFTFKFYKSTEIQCSNLAYGETDNSRGYHGFTSDADMLDASGTGPVDPDTPVTHSNFDYQGGNYRAGLGDVYSAEPMSGYQP